jgi:hypothetical protein
LVIAAAAAAGELLRGTAPGKFAALWKNAAPNSLHEPYAALQQAQMCLTRPLFSALSSPLAALEIHDSTPWMRLLFVGCIHPIFARLC